MTRPANHPVFAHQQHPARRRGGQAGALTVEFAFAAVICMLLVAVGWQTAVIYHTRTVLLAAAQDAARSAAVLTGSPQAGYDRAVALLDTGLGSAARHATIHIDRGPEHTQVTITLPVTAVLPWPAGPHLVARHEQHTEPQLAVARRDAPR